MTTEELYMHLRRVAEQYYIDASALREQEDPRPGDDLLAVRYDGKADGFWVAAAWLKEYLIDGNV